MSHAEFLVSMRNSAMARAKMAYAAAKKRDVWGSDWTDSAAYWWRVWGQSMQQIQRDNRMLRDELSRGYFRV